MKEIKVRGDDAFIAAITQAAENAGVSREEWVRIKLDAALKDPDIRGIYTLSAKGEGGARVKIERGGSGIVSSSMSKLSGRQLEMWNQVQILVDRNEPGDKEKAVELLEQAGLTVTEDK